MGGRVEFEKNEDGCFFVNIYPGGGRKNFGEEVRDYMWQVHPEDFDRVKNRITQIIEGRPHIKDFPHSEIETKDQFDLMKQAEYQCCFFNGRWITREEESEIRKMMLDAYDKFHGGELAVFGSFPGMTVFCLMQDQGLEHLPIY